MKYQKTEGPDMHHPFEVDVICGRSGTARKHPGNAIFRTIVSQHRVSPWDYLVVH